MSAMPSSTSSPDLPYKPRNLVLMLDGTSNQFSEHNSNLIKLMSVVKADEGQLLFYSSGLGTILPDSASTWGIFKQKAAEVIDMGLAWNFDQFVQDGYKWLMDNYRDGDKIFLFGFSRGAYTARALAGMIQRVGLLNPGNHNQVAPAYELYTSEVKWKGSDGQPKDPAVLYRRIFGRSRPVTVEFLGVWDTVSSLGGIDLPQLPFASGAKSIKFFRQALALDERRARFVPEYWRMDEEEIAMRSKIHHLRSTIAHHPGTAEAEEAKESIDALSAQLNALYPQTDYAILSDGSKKELRKHAEVWFMGCHSDVGGGNDLNDQPSLSNIPFRWMLREAVKVGLVLNPSGVALSTALQLPNTLILRSSLDLQSDNKASTSNADADSPDPLDPRLNALHQLTKILRAQDDDPKKGIDGWAECKPYTAQLPQSVMAEIVEAAARLDAYPDGADGAALGPSVAPARGGAGGTELSADAKKPYTESLTLAWKPVEGLLLGTRHYTPEGAKKCDVVRMNLGRGRQIIPEQKLHRSVGLRMIHDTETASQQRTLRKKGYFSPKAYIAAGWPSWQDIAQGRADESDVWEE